MSDDAVSHQRKRIGGEIHRREIVKFIMDFHNRRGFSPSVREICDGVPGLTSTSVVSYHLNQLAREGVIRRDALTPRSIVVINKEWINEDGDGGNESERRPT